MSDKPKITTNQNRIFPDKELTVYIIENRRWRRDYVDFAMLIFFVTIAGLLPLKYAVNLGNSGGSGAGFGAIVARANAASISSVTVPNGAYLPGQNLDFTVVFDAPVNVNLPLERVLGAAVDYGLRKRCLF